MSPARSEPVVAHRVRVEHRDTEVLLSCALRAPAGELPPELWLRMPVEVGPYVSAAGDPFLPPLLLFCMRAGVPLVIEADVSAMLLSAVRRIQDLYCGWAADRGDRLTHVEVNSGIATRSRDGESSAAFFSCGVDSFYTLLANRYPPSDARFIQHLLLVHGFDIALADRLLFEQVERHARSVAQHFGKNLITVQTNVRLATQGVDWGYYGHGVGLASVGLALGNLVHTVFIPSTLALHDLRPWGSHPALDPLWSSEQIEFVHHGAEARRIDKVRLVSTSPDALQSLRVCWTNPDGAYNCGRCEKCLRTMAELEVSGALSQAAMFPRSIELRALESLVIPESARSHWLATIEAARDSASHLALVAAIRKALQNSERQDSRWWRRVLPSAGARSAHASVPEPPRAMNVLLVTHREQDQHRILPEVLSQLRQMTEGYRFRLVWDSASHLKHQLWGLGRPTVVISMRSATAGRRFTPKWAIVWQQLALDKIEECEILEHAGLPVPKWAVLQPDSQPDLTDFDEFVVVKPAAGKVGALVRVKRKSRVRWKPVELLARTGETFSQAWIVQKYIHTGCWPSSYRVGTVFGEPIYALRFVADRGRKPFEAIPSHSRDFDNRCIVASSRGCTVDTEVPADVIALGSRVHQAFPTIPLLGVDILRDSATGQLYIIEVNARGWTFHLSSDNYHRIRSETGLDLRAQFGGATAVARGIARRLREVGAR